MNCVCMCVRVCVLHQYLFACFTRQHLHSCSREAAVVATLWKSLSAMCDASFSLPSSPLLSLLTVGVWRHVHPQLSQLAAMFHTQTQNAVTWFLWSRAFQIWRQKMSVCPCSLEDSNKEEESSVTDCSSEGLWPPVEWIEWIQFIFVSSISRKILQFLHVSSCAKAAYLCLIAAAATKRFFFSRGTTGEIIFTEQRDRNSSATQSWLTQFVYMHNEVELRFKLD